MSQLIERLADIVWGPWTVAAVLAAGLLFSAAAGFPQITRFGQWWRGTLGGQLAGHLTELRADGCGRGHTGRCGNATAPECSAAPSPLAATLASLAGTLGTGNIVGVAAALTAGGAGAVFWMVAAGLLGMMTSYVENAVGTALRERGADGGWLGGPMIYLKKIGFPRLGRAAAALWAAACTAAAFGVGNMAQVSSAAAALEGAWGLPRWAAGAGLLLLAAPAVLGGTRGTVRLCEKLVPVMAGLYMLGCGAVLTVNAAQIPAALLAIVRGAFTARAVGGGFLGAMITGVRRGIFTNEAGLGTAVVLHSTADAEPHTQGMWGMFGVFFDTVVMCTVTALTVLTSGADYAESTDGTALGAEAFGCVLGRFSGSFVAASLALFAFATVIAWGSTGEKAFTSLTGGRWTGGYRLLYCAAILPGAVMSMKTVWALADVADGVMALVNLGGLALIATNGKWKAESEKWKMENEKWRRV